VGDEKKGGIAGKEHFRHRRGAQKEARTRGKGGGKITHQ